MEVTCFIYVPFCFSWKLGKQACTDEQLPSNNILQKFSTKFSGKPTAGGLYGEENIICKNSLGKREVGFGSSVTTTNQGIN